MTTDAIARPFAKVLLVAQRTRRAWSRQEREWRGCGCDRSTVTCGVWPCAGSVDWWSSLRAC